MSQVSKMVLKPREKLVTRLFLSHNVTQSLGILSYSNHDLINVMKDLADSNPFVSLKRPKRDFKNLDWIEDSAEESLVDHLLEEVRLSSWSKRIQEVVTYLIYQLDNNGYLRVDLDKIANVSQFNLNELEEGKKYLNSLEPIGIGAFNLNDCLLIQAEQKEDFNNLALKILQQNQLEILAETTRWTEISSDIEAVEEALSVIQTLNPNPAQDYQSSFITQYLIPDLKFSVEDNQIFVTSSSDQIPELIFDEEGFSEMEKSLGDNQNFLKKQKNAYIDIQEAIHRRQATILRIGKLVGKYQSDFLRSLNPKDLRPLGIKKVADELNLSPSTISRAIKEKYVEYQSQIFSLKYFFPRQAKEEYSQIFVQEELKELINGENKENPLSDAMLVDLFEKKGIKISRRVIAKYRKQLGIGNSYSRKK